MRMILLNWFCAASSLPYLWSADDMSLNFPPAPIASDSTMCANRHDRIELNRTLYSKIMANYIDPSHRTRTHSFTHNDDVK